MEARDDTDIDPDLIRFLRLKLIDGRDSFILESCFSRTVFETLAEPFSKDNEIKVHEYILQLCTSLLEGIDTAGGGAAQDTAILASQGRSDPPFDYATQSPAVALALLRTQERAALRNTISKMEAELVLLKVNL